MMPPMARIGAGEARQRARIEQYFGRAVRLQRPTSERTVRLGTNCFLITSERQPLTGRGPLL
jgi:hypothetical protein